jgi:hypothetical protein
MITQKIVKHYFELKDDCLYWKNVVHLNQSKLIGQKAGSIHSTGYKHITFNGKVYKSHRLIWLYVYGYLPKEIDHINGDRQDNRLENLREVTRSQNQFNKCLAKNNTSGTKGVSWHKKSKSWTVRLCINKKPKHLGYFKDLELANLVAQEARNKYYGEYARHF